MPSKSKESLDKKSSQAGHQDVHHQTSIESMVWLIHQEWSVALAMSGWASWAWCGSLTRNEVLHLPWVAGYHEHGVAHLPGMKCCTCPEWLGIMSMVWLTHQEWIVALAMSGWVSWAWCGSFTRNEVLHLLRVAGYHEHGVAHSPGMKCCTCPEWLGIMSTVWLTHQEWSVALATSGWASWAWCGSLTRNEVLHLPWVAGHHEHGVAHSPGMKCCTCHEWLGIMSMVWLTHQEWSVALAMSGWASWAWCGSLTRNEVLHLPRVAGYHEHVVAHSPGMECCTCYEWLGIMSMVWLTHQEWSVALAMSGWASWAWCGSLTRNEVLHLPRVAGHHEHGVAHSPGMKCCTCHEWLGIMSMVWLIHQEWSVALAMSGWASWAWCGSLTRNEVLHLPWVAGHHEHGVAHSPGMKCCTCHEWLGIMSMLWLTHQEWSVALATSGWVSWAWCGSFTRNEVLHLPWVAGYHEHGVAHSPGMKCCTCHEWLGIMSMVWLTHQEWSVALAMSGWVSWAWCGSLTRNEVLHLPRVAGYHEHGVAHSPGMKCCTCYERLGIMSMVWLTHQEWSVALAMSGWVSWAWCGSLTRNEVLHLPRVAGYHEHGVAHSPGMKCCTYHEWLGIMSMVWLTHQEWSVALATSGWVSWAWCGSLTRNEVLHLPRVAGYHEHGVAHSPGMKCCTCHEWLGIMSMVWLTHQEWSVAFAMSGWVSWAWCGSLTRNEVLYLPRVAGHHEHGVAHSPGMKCCTCHEWQGIMSMVWLTHQEWSVALAMSGWVSWAWCGSLTRNEVLHLLWVAGYHEHGVAHSPGMKCCTCHEWLGIMSMVWLTHQEWSVALAMSGWVSWAWCGSLTRNEVLHLPRVAGYHEHGVAHSPGMECCTCYEWLGIMSMVWLIHQEWSVALAPSGWVSWAWCGSFTRNEVLHLPRVAGYHEHGVAHSPGMKCCTCPEWLGIMSMVWLTHQEWSGALATGITCELWTLHTRLLVWWGGGETTCASLQHRMEVASKEPIGEHSKTSHCAANMVIDTCSVSSLHITLKFTLGSRTWIIRMWSKFLGRGNLDFRGYHTATPQTFPLKSPAWTLRICS